jgi:hypothetical protein
MNKTNILAIVIGMILMVSCTKTTNTENGKCCNDSTAVDTTSVMIITDSTTSEDGDTNNLILE